ncbi:Amidohydrolase family domain containing protein, partial [Naviculisporaceae sp. PSN 640]
MAPAPAPTPATSRWGLRLSSLAGVAAVLVAAFQFQQKSQSVENETVYCYEGVKTEALALSQGENKFNCFGVSPSTGRFTRVFESNSLESSTADIRKGHVLPGLWDGHGHLMQYGEFLHSADLFGSKSFDEIRGRLRGYLDSKLGSGTRDNWARGIGWDQMALGGMPTADLLEEDEQLRGKYFMLDRVDVHCTWVSQAVLDLLPDDIPDVPGGEIVRTPGMGVFCDNAMDIVMSLWPRPNAAKKKEFVKSAMRELHKGGLVGMHDAGVFPRDIALYNEMSQSSEDWTLRVYAMLECAERNTFCPQDAKKIEHPDGLFTVRSVKLFADGALGSWGSAMIEPYTDRPSTSGSLLVNASTLTSLTKSWAGHGFQVNIHAIGDLANRYAIDAFNATLFHLYGPSSSESSYRSLQTTHHRFRIEHSQIIHPADQIRMSKLGIIPSIQPTHATSDMAYAGKRLGPQRTAAEAYRMKSFLTKLDLSPVLGSDFPVEPPNPFEGIYAAVTRKNPHTGLGAPGEEDKGWYTEEALTLEEALAGFTKGAAYGAFLDGQAGIIKEGAFGDWIVLDEDIEKVGEEDIRKVQVRETWVGGRRVYSREEE